jgi:transcription antitermination factor NusG
VLKLNKKDPPMSPEGKPSVTDLVGNWWVGHTKARTEKAFAWDMISAGVGYFLPMVKRVTFTGGRKRHFMQPLFPGYVFFCGDEKARYAALSTKRLCQAIEVFDRAHLIDELSSIERVIKFGMALEFYPFAVVGKRCRVTKGPLQGTEGVVIRRDNSTRFVLEVSVLGKGASLEIDADLLEPAE